MILCILIFSIHPHCFHILLYGFPQRQPSAGRAPRGGKEAAPQTEQEGLGSFVEANSARRKMPVAKLLLPAHNANLFRGGGRRSSSSLSSSLDRARHHVLITIIVVCNGILVRRQHRNLRAVTKKPPWRPGSSHPPWTLAGSLQRHWDSPRQRQEPGPRIMPKDSEEEKSEEPGIMVTVSSLGLSGSWVCGSRNNPESTVQLFGTELAESSM